MQFNPTIIEVENTFIVNFCFHTHLRDYFNVLFHMLILRDFQKFVSLILQDQIKAWKYLEKYVKIPGSNDYSMIMKRCLLWDLLLSFIGPLGKCFIILVTQKSITEDSIWDYFKWSFKSYIRHNLVQLYRVEK